MSTIEVPVGIICACLPAIRSLFSVVFPRVFGTSRGAAATGSSYYYASGGGSRGKGNNYRRSSGGAVLSGSSGGGGGGGSKNKISVRHEWTVLSNPVASDGNINNFEGGNGSRSRSNNNCHNHNHNHNHSGSDSDVELVGVAVSSDGVGDHFVVGGGGDGSGGSEGGGVAGQTVVEVVTTARPETPWDGTIGTVSGNNGARSKFYVTGNKLN